MYILIDFQLLHFYRKKHFILKLESSLKRITFNTFFCPARLKRNTNIHLYLKIILEFNQHGLFDGITKLSTVVGVLQATFTEPSTDTQAEL